MERCCWGRGMGSVSLMERGRNISACVIHRRRHDSLPREAARSSNALRGAFVSLSLCNSTRYHRACDTHTHTHTLQLPHLQYFKGLSLISLTSLFCLSFSLYLHLSPPTPILIPNLPSSPFISLSISLPHSLCFISLHRLVHFLISPSPSLLFSTSFPSSCPSSN